LVDSFVEDRRQLIAGNRVRLLRDGAQIFPAWLEAIEAARAQISLEMYIFADDGIGRRVAEALCRAAERGVAVRVLYDDVGCRLTPRAFFEAMRARGVMTIAYHRNRRFVPRVWKMFRRNHRKNLVVDHHTGFVGGLNISNAWVPSIEGGDDWRDAVVEVRGPGAWALEAAFAETWNPRARRGARLPVGPGPAPSALAVPAEGTTVAGTTTAGTTKLAVVTNSERGARFAIRRSILHALRASRHRIWLANPYFVPDRGFSLELERAAERGIDVRVLVPARSDSNILDAAAHATFPRLLGAGVRIWRSPAVIHTKAIAVDDVFVSLGSYNLDHRSLAYNLEIVVNVIEEDFNRRVAEMLASEMFFSSEVTRQALAEEPLLARIGDRLAYGLRRWL
jgi:cardiolipin synthase